MLHNVFRLLKRFFMRASNARRECEAGEASGGLAVDGVSWEPLAFVDPLLSLPPGAPELRSIESRRVRAPGSARAGANAWVA